MQVKDLTRFQVGMLEVRRPAYLGGRKSSAETFLLHLQHQLKPQSFEELKLKVKVMEFGYKTGPLVRQFLCRSETKFCERFFR
jgi:hypothetical protein